MSLVVRGLDKRHGEAVALAGVDLDLPASGYVCIMGPSGCGKTTLLRILAGLERADAGTIAWADRSLDGVAAEHRPLRMVFQHGALFSHLDVGRNVGFALELAGLGGDALARRVDELLEWVELPAALARRSTIDLSGGERQRVALARALADGPAVLLLDEPLTAIDRPQRAGLRRRLRELQRGRGGLFVHVTHDPLEALALADHLVVLDRGRVVAHGEPETLYSRPTDATAARLLGALTEVPGEPKMSLRCERLVPTDDDARARGTIVDRVRIGDMIELTIDVGIQRVRMHVTATTTATEVGLTWDDADVFPFAAC
jgi:ABC-type Fe3+/spermidine/putrescine transport system ATPase subunit